MARFLSQALALRRSQLISTQGWRFRSTLSRKDRLIEVDMLSSSPSSEVGGSDSEALMLKRLEDIVHRLIVLKATPDWLPFLPGSSFWVPPRRGPVKFGDVIGKLADRLSEEESLSVSSDRGWPSSRFFAEGSGFGQTMVLDMRADESAVVDSEVEEEVPTDLQDSHPFEGKEG